MVETILECRTPDNYAKSFTKHKKCFVKYDKNKDKKNPNYSVMSRYSSLLKGLHWYEQTFDFLRNKIIEHGGNLVGSIRTTQNGAEYRRITKNFGFLENNDKHQDKKMIEQMIHDYGKKMNTLEIYN